MEKIYGIEYSFFGFDSEGSSREEGLYVFYRNRVHEVRNSWVDNWNGDKGYRISGHTLKKEKKNEEFYIDGDSLFNNKAECLGKIQWGFFPDWVNKKFRDFGIPEFIKVKAYGGCNYYRILPELFETKVKKIMDMGFSETEAKKLASLKDCKWKWELMPLNPKKALKDIPEYTVRNLQQYFGITYPRAESMKRICDCLKK